MLCHHTKRVNSFFQSSRCYIDNMKRIVARPCFSKQLCHSCSRWAMPWFWAVACSLTWQWHFLTHFVESFYSTKFKIPTAGSRLMQSLTKARTRVLITECNYLTHHIFLTPHCLLWGKSIITSVWVQSSKSEYSIFIIYAVQFFKLGIGLTGFNSNSSCSVLLKFEFLWIPSI